MTEPSRNFTKVDITNAVREKTGFLKDESGALVDIVLETMKATLARGDKLVISNFGTFIPRSKRARRGRNPKTKQDMLLPARTVLVFKASPTLKVLVDSERQSS